MLPQRASCRPGVIARCSIAEAITREEELASECAKNRPWKEPSFDDQLLLLACNYCVWSKTLVHVASLSKVLYMRGWSCRPRLKRTSQDMAECEIVDADH